ncbi:MAG: ATP-binding protein [Ruminiclostridium sp.]|nr:ATP-binding protein [Ruminiclostridium sp.]
MKEITVRAMDEELNNVIAFVTEELETVDCPMKTQMQIEVAVEELFVNIAHYAYTPNIGDATIQVDINDARELTVTFIDSGMQYDPLAKPDPDVTLSVEQRKIGGLGIYMVKKSMDDMRYRYEGGKNILTIVKKV